MNRTLIAAVCAVALLTTLGLAQPSDGPAVSPPKHSPGEGMILIGPGESGQAWEKLWPWPTDDNPAGEKKYGYLGVSPAPVPPPMAGHLGLDDGRGVLLVAVLEDSPAAKAGLRSHDVIVQIDDQIIYAVEQLQKLIAARKPDSTVAVRLVRTGKEQTIKVQLGGTARRSWRYGPGFGLGLGVWPMPEHRPGWGVFRFHIPEGRELEIRVPSGKDLLRRLEPLREDFPPKAWEKLKEKLEGMLKAPAARDLIKSLEPLKEDLPPRLWERLKKMLEEAPARPEPKKESEEPKHPEKRPEDRTRHDQPPARPLGGEHKVELRVGPKAGGGVMVGGQAIAGAGAMAMTTASAASANYRATWEKRTGQPTLISLYSKDGKAIFEKVTPDMLPKLLETLDDEARTLLSGARISIRIDEQEQE